MWSARAALGQDRASIESSEVGFSQIASYAKWIADLKPGTIPEQTPLSQKRQGWAQRWGWSFCLLIWPVS
jgi:hypothetical protein